MYDTRIEIVERSEVRDDYNEKESVYRTIMLCDAAKTMHGGKKNLFASRIVNDNEVVYTIRWRTGITPSMFVREQGVLMPIISVYEEGRRFRLHLKVSLGDHDDYGEY